MILELHAKNFALFEDIDIEFSDKLNVITGESGSGKSLFLSILKSLLGEKNEFLTEKSEVESRFLISGEEFVINLKISPSRMSARLNGEMITLADLKNHVGGWMDIHNQGISRILKDPKNHTNFVDIFSSNIQDQLKKYRILYNRYVEISKFIKINESTNPETEIENISQEISNIEKFLISDEEYNVIRDEYKRQSGIVDILKMIKETEYLVWGENGIEPILGLVLKDVKEIEKIDKNLPFLKMIEEIKASLMDLKKHITDYANSLEFDQEKLYDLEEKIDQIEKLKRKYGPRLSDVNERLEKLKNRYEQLNEVNIQLKNVREDFKDLTDQMKTIALEIKRMRGLAAAALVKRINENLEDLSMKNAHISFIQKDTDFTQNGKDQIEFTGSMNLGMPETSVSKIASGGEISRLYLAIESSISGNLPISTLVFDEIETGIGPRTSDVVATKMKEISKNTQVIVITHMPQIAAVADRHFKVQKYQSNGSTYSTIKEINGKERQAEIKEMFGKIPNQQK
jgi:DNA repair protein RecN (Recombination protein N)